MTRGAAARARAMKALAGLICLTTTASCAAPLVPTPTLEASCPPGWRAAVMFSSQYETESVLSFVGPDGVAEQRRIPYQGFGPSPATVKSQDGPDVWLGANGDVVRNKTHLVHFSTSTCAVDALRVPEQLLRSILGTQGGVLSTNSPVSGAVVRWRTSQGTMIADTVLPGLDITAWARHGTHLLGVGWDVAAEQAVVIEFSTPSLTETRRTLLPDTASPGYGTAVIGDYLYYTSSISAPDTEGTNLGRLNLDTFTAETFAPTGISPYLIAQAPESLYVGNTFINPAFRPMEEYRTVTRVMLDTADTTTIDVGGPILDIALEGDELVTVTGDIDVDPTISRFNRFTGERIEAITVPKPPGTVYYIAGLILPPASDRS